MTLISDLPNLFIIGAAKAGTTTLYTILRHHPDVFFPFDKEPAFFSDDEYYEKGVGWYLNTFYKRTNSKRIRGDATSRYLYWGEKVAPRLQDIYEHNMPRIIAIFRDPVALVHSFYWHSVREGRENLSLKEALFVEEQRLKENDDFLSRRGQIVYGYSRIGLYAKQLDPYLRRFPKENFLFLLTDDLRNPSQLIKKLEEFLGLEHSDKLKPVTSNSASLPRSYKIHQWLRNTSRVKDILKIFIPFSFRHRLKMFAIDVNLKPFQTPPLDPEISYNLRQHYKNEMGRLQDIIGRDLSSWQ